MNICLEGPSGDWDWFEADLREDDLGLNRDKINSICGTTNPQVIDIEYDDNEPYKELLQYDGMGWTSLDSLVNQAEQLTQFEDYELEQIAAYMNTKSGDLSYAMDHFDNHQYWKTDNSNIEDFAREYLEDTGYDADFLAQYFDYAALGEELLDDPDYEPLSDNGNAWDEGELYIDEMWGSVEDFIAQHDLDTVFDYYFDLEGFANGNLRYGFTYDDETGIWVSESFSTKSNKKTIKENYSDNRFRVTSYYDNNYRGVGSSEDFDSYDEAEEYAHDRLINGENILITDTETGNRVMINSHEYTMKFDGDFVVNTDIYDFKQSVLRSYESVNRRSVKRNIKESIDLTQSFKDPQGMFGEPGAIVTAQELKDYWDNEYEWDPCLQDFNSFEDWYEDTIEWFEPIYESVKESYSDNKYTGTTWNNFIDDIEFNSDYKVDSTYRRKYDQWIELIDNNGKIYDAEVTMYKDRLGNITYELMSYNITPSYQYESIKRNRRINKGRCESTNKRFRTRKIVKESITKHQYDILQNACMNCNTINDLDSILSSLLTVDKNLYLKYSNKAVHDTYSASALAKDISDDLYYAFPEYND